MIPILISIKDFALKHKKPLAIALLTVIVAFVLLKGFTSISQYISDRRFAGLEQQITDSKNRVQQLEGQIQLLKGQLGEVNGQLLQSNERVVAAESRADSAKTVYVTTRAKGPTFVNVEPDKQVKELEDLLNKLYP